MARRGAVSTGMAQVSFPRTRRASRGRVHDRLNFTSIVYSHRAQSSLKRARLRAWERVGGTGQQKEAKKAKSGKKGKWPFFAFFATFCLFCFSFRAKESAK